MKGKYDVVVFGGGTAGVVAAIQAGRAGAGVRFRRAYSSCPTCIAARRSLLSGQFPATHGMRGYREGVPWEIDEKEMES